ncbi:MAG: hypothetical protein ACE5RN_02550 [Nitrosopumilaceae archaeon]
MKNTQLLSQVRHPEPLENLVESMPVKDGMKLSEISSMSNFSKDLWMDIRGLGWIFCEDWS